MFRKKKKLFVRLDRPEIDQAAGACEKRVRPDRRQVLRPVVVALPAVRHIVRLAAEEDVVERRVVKDVAEGAVDLLEPASSSR